MSFLLVRRPPPPSSLISRVALRPISLSSPTSTAHVAATILRAVRPQPVSALSALSRHNPNPKRNPFVNFFRSKTQQLLCLRRQYATFKKNELVPPSQVKGSENLPERPEQQLRLLDRLKARGQISDHKVPPTLTKTQRLLKPFLFTTAVSILSYAYTLYWTPPSMDKRMFPSIPQSAATVGGLILANVGIFLLWKVPIPLNWRILNKYFICVPGLPVSFSLLGATFSHQSFVHLAVNCFGLYIFGSTLCDQIGRGNFLGLYFGSGVISSFASLAYHVFRAQFHVFALGASGAISGIAGAYAYFNPNRELMFVFFPFMTFKAAHLVGFGAGLEIWGLIRGYKRIDHMAHLTGLTVGVLSGYGMWHAAKRRGERRIKRWWGERW
ncbi:hypothetical protein BDZ91DRAFT_693886 [Kalaharituber pfeilii]|nr:hypothetical protein BDZ91DRAFT_693886 [Kalaharituber pfeilii]